MSTTTIREFDGDGKLIRETVIERDEVGLVPPLPPTTSPWQTIYKGLYWQIPDTRAHALQTFNPCAECVRRGGVCDNVACPSAVRITC